jgi:hypothetical protein
LLDLIRHPEALAEGIGVPLKGEMDAIKFPNSFQELLYLLMSPELGGNEFTEALGLYLRCQGVNALVYPSARTKVGIHCRSGQLISSIGWNLVDYRNASLPVSKPRELSSMIFAPSHYSEHFKFESLKEIDGEAWVIAPPTLKHSLKAEIFGKGADYRAQ